MEFQKTDLYKDYLETYADALPTGDIISERLRREKSKTSNVMTEFLSALEGLPDVETNFFDFSSPAVTIGQESDLSNDEHKSLEKILKEFIPWKKGPWNIFGHEIDAEWRSDFKWERVANNMGSLEGKKIADIGCNNGYFMYRMLAHAPELVIGFEPFVKNYITYNIFQKYARSSKLHFELLGVENFDLYPKFFDKIFCLGILYHHTDPIGLLRKLYASLDKGGEIIIDCQGIPGDDPVALMPQTRYTNAKGFWWLPTKACLQNWLSRTQFRDIEFFFEEPLALSEQRSTEWCPHNSLEDFLDPNDQTKTVEGYPAPWRYYVRAKK